MPKRKVEPQAEPVESQESESVRNDPLVSREGFRSALADWLGKAPKKGSVFIMVKQDQWEPFDKETTYSKGAIPGIFRQLLDGPNDTKRAEFIIRGNVEKSADLEALQKAGLGQRLKVS